MRYYLFVILVLLLPLTCEAFEKQMPEYIISNQSFKESVDSALQHSKAPDKLPVTWVINGYVYLSVDYGWNGMQTPKIDRDTWHVLLLYDGGICETDTFGVVNLCGHWLCLDETFLKIGLFTPTGKTCTVDVCKSESKWGCD